LGAAAPDFRPATGCGHKCSSLSITSLSSGVSANE
jgi:hypothetical protein